MAAALRESVVVVLTGAGASVPLGFPATAEFRVRFAESVAQRFVGQGDDMVRFAIDRMNAPGNQDIEQVLARLENESYCADTLLSVPDFVSPVLAGDVGEMSQFKGRCDRLRESIYDEVLRTYGRVDRDRAVSLYRGLIGVYGQAADVTGGNTTLPIFTLNYDTAVEHAAVALGAQLIDGFVPGPGGQRVWSSAQFSKFEPRRDRLTVVLVKLHGSVLLGTRRIDTGKDELVELAEGLDRDPSPFDHVVLYPSLRPKPLGEEPFRTGYGLLRMSLEQANLLFVIGCSFRDEQLNELLRDSLDRNPDLRLVAVDPELARPALRFSAVFPRQSHVRYYRSLRW
jgi:hypothetical protein